MPSMLIRKMNELEEILGITPTEIRESNRSNIVQILSPFKKSITSNLTVIQAVYQLTWIFEEFIWGLTFEFEFMNEHFVQLIPKNEQGPQIDMLFHDKKLLLCMAIFFVFWSAIYKSNLDAKPRVFSNEPKSLLA